MRTVQTPAAPPLDATKVARRLAAMAEMTRHLSEADLMIADGAVQDALAELAFNHGFARLARRVATIRRATQRDAG